MPLARLRSAIEVINRPKDARGFVLLPKRWVVEIVWTQMTKADVLGPGAGRQHVADLDLILGDDHPIDQQFDELTPPLEARPFQAGGDPPAERLECRRQAEDLGEPPRLAGQPRLLRGQCRLACPQGAAPATVLLQRDDPAQVPFGQPAELPAQRRLALAQPLPPRLELLRMPAPTAALRNASDAISVCRTSSQRSA